MKVNNGGEADLTGFQVSVNFADERGNQVAVTTNAHADEDEYSFFYRLTNPASVPNKIVAGENKELVWLIVPTRASGGIVPAGQLYFVVARVSYTSDGVDSVIDVQPDSIRVLPMRALALGYLVEVAGYTRMVAARGTLCRQSGGAH